MENQLHTGRRTKGNKLQVTGTRLKRLQQTIKYTTITGKKRIHKYHAPEGILLWCADRCKAVRPRYKERRYGCAGVEGEHLNGVCCGVQTDARPCDPGIKSASMGAPELRGSTNKFWEVLYPMRWEAMVSGTITGNTRKYMGYILWHANAIRN